MTAHPRSSVVLLHIFVIDVAFRSRLSAKAAYNIFIEDLVLAKVLTAEATEKSKEQFL